MAALHDGRSPDDHLSCCLATSPLPHIRGTLSDHRPPRGPHLPTPPSTATRLLSTSPHPSPPSPYKPLHHPTHPRHPPVRQVMAQNFGSHGSEHYTSEGGGDSDLLQPYVSFTINVEG